MSRKHDQPYKSSISKDRLGILFGETPTEASDTTSLTIEQICLPASQPRRYFDRSAMQELTRSIQKHGILQPVIVRPIAGGSYELVAGERRYRAAQEIGLPEIPVVIREMTAEEAAQVALIENLQREGLNPVEETEGTLQLLSVQLQCSIEEVTLLLYRLRNQAKADPSYNVIASAEGQIVQQVFDGLGRMTWDSFIINRLPLLRLPQNILEALRSGQIAYTKATTIARVKDDQMRQEILEAAVEQDLSLSQIRERIKSLQPSPELEKPDFAERVKRMYQAVQKSRAWENPKKRKQLENLLAKLENLVVDD